jgi:hypothetical protein
MTPSPMPADLARERGEVLHKALRTLPDELLSALLVGVRRHADMLMPGSLDGDDGACAVGLMLHELRGTNPNARFRRRQRPTIHEEAPEIAREHPRLAHLEFIFDHTCEQLALRRGEAVCDVAPSVGLWMAGEVAAEMNLRHMEAAAAEGPPTGSIEIDPELFGQTVARIRRLRPWLSDEQAGRLVEAVLGARRVEDMVVPPEWSRELELQRERVGIPA